MKTSDIRSVEIPNEDQGVFASIARLADPALEGLERALRDATPTLGRRELMLQLRKEPALAELSDLEEIVSALISLVGTAYTGKVEVGDFVEVVVDAILTDNVVELSKAEASLLTERLKRLTKLDCLEIVAKGNVILRANDRNFRSASIVSDLRPVITGNELKVSGALILHQLAIRASQNGRSKTTYFALDSEDLASLSEVVARAINKEQSLREFTNRSATPVLIPNVEE